MNTHESYPNASSTKSGAQTVMGEIRDLEPVAKSLNKESNELREILATFNSKIGALNIGLEVWMSDHNSHSIAACVFSKGVWPSRGTVEKDEPPSDDHFFAWELGYAKLGDQWSVAVRPVWALVVTSPDYERDDEVVPAGQERSILDAPRSVRIAAAGRLSDLIDCIKEAAEAGVQAIQNARRLAENL